MFEVGKTYWMTTIEGGEETQRHITVERYEHPLLKTADRELSGDFLGDLAEKGETTVIRGSIINVTSPYFVSATLEGESEPIESSARVRFV